MHQGHRFSVFSLAVLLGLAALTQAHGEQICRPELQIQNVQFSEMQPKMLRRTWSAVVTVDASACAPNASGTFDLAYTRLQEIGPDHDFRERLTWRAPAVKVELEFASIEAMQRYWIENVSACACARN
jgi:hypothetical protein